VIARYRCDLHGISGSQSGVAMPDTRKTVQLLREQAARCRHLAGAILDAAVSRRLLELATEFEERADAEEARQRCP
jgi:hypothetical protein